MILFLWIFHDYITSNSEYIRYLIEQAIKKGYVVWCNTNYTNLDDVMEHLNPTGSYKIIEIKKDLSYDEALRIANEIGLNGVPEHFDGNIGSIFYQLDKKSETYRKLSPNQKMILKAIKVLYHFGLYTPLSGIKKQDLKRLVKIWEEFHFRAFEEDMQRLAAIKFIDELKQADFVQYDEILVKRIVEDNFNPQQYIREVSSLFVNNSQIFNNAIQSSTDYEEANFFYQKMLDACVQPNETTYYWMIKKAKDFSIQFQIFQDGASWSTKIGSKLLPLIKHYAKSSPENIKQLNLFLAENDIPVITQIEKYDIKNGKTNDLYQYTILLNSAKSFDDIKRIYEDVKRQNLKRDIVFYNVMIQNCGSIENGYEIINWMKEDGKHPDSFTLFQMINLSNDFKKASGLLSEFLNLNVIPNQGVYRLMMKMADNYDSVLSLLNQMIERKTLVTAGTYGYVMSKAPEYHEAKSVFDMMIKNNCNPTKFEYGTLINRAPDFKVAKEIFFSMLLNDIAATEIEYSTLMNKAESYSDAMEIFNKIKILGMNINARIYGTLMSKTNDYTIALGHYDEMVSSGIIPSTEIFGCLINLSSNYYEGRRLIKEMEYFELPLNTRLYGALLKCSNSFNIGEEILIEMNEKDIEINVEILRLMIKFAPNYAIARNYFDEISRRKLVVNRETYNTLIKHVTSVDQGMRLVNEMSKYNLTPDEFTYKTLLKVACNFDESLKIMKAYNLDKSYLSPLQLSGLISKFHDFKTADQLVTRMLDENLNPGTGAFVILMRLTRVIENRKAILEKMIKYNVERNIKFYAICINTCSNLEEAKYFYINMIEENIIPNSIILHHMHPFFCRNKAAGREFISNAISMYSITTDINIITAKVELSDTLEEIFDLLNEMKQFGIKPSRRLQEILMIKAGNNIENINRITEIVNELLA